MAEPVKNELSHEEALELLPWLVNASLNEGLSRQVARHVDGCETCQQEWAILSSTILAFNTSEPDYQDVDNRFQNLMHRIRDEEKLAQDDLHDSTEQSFGARLAAWLGLSRNRQQWAVAFTLGLIVGGGAIMTALNLTDSRLDNDYTVLSGDQSTLQLQVLFVEPPGPEALDELQREHGAALRWQRISGDEYVIVFPEDASVRNLAAVRSKLLSDDSIEDVSIDLR